MIMFEWLVEVFKELMPNANNKFCVRHMHSNFYNNGHTRKALKNFMWKVARAYKKSKHKYYMDKINSISGKAHAFLGKFHPWVWCC